MYECFHCGSRSVIWDCDYDYADYGMEGNGVIHVCHRKNCGATIAVASEELHGNGVTTRSSSKGN